MKTEADTTEELKESWLNLFEEEGEVGIVETLQDIELEDLGDEETYQQLKNSASSKKGRSYVESLRKEVEDLLGLSRSSFNIDDYEGLNKTDIAREMADYVVNTERIRPVYIGQDQDQRMLMQFNRDTGIWEYFSDTRIGRKCKALSGEEYTQHMKTAFKINLLDHGNYNIIEEMGLPEDKVLLKDSTVLHLDDLSNLAELETSVIEPDDHALHKVNANYRPGESCPRFEKFVDTLLDGKENQVKTLQEFMGWLLKHPDRTYKKMLLILGVSNSGKSQLCELIEELFKKNNGSSVTNISLPQIGYRRRFHIEPLQRTVVNMDKDLSNSEIDDASNIKSVASMEKMNVEPKGEDSFTIQPIAKHIIAANVAPKPPNQGDEAFYQRFLTLKAPKAVPKPQREKDLGRKIFEEEADGILNWMLEGLKRLEEQGDFTISPNPYETKLMWHEFGNSAERFLNSACEITRDSEDKVPKSDFYEHYEKWMESRMLEKMTPQEFHHHLNNAVEIGNERFRLDGVQKRCYWGVDVDIDSIYDLEDDLRDSR